MDISKSVILVTAAGTPTGLAIAEHLCNLGAKVVIVDANSEKLDDTYRACMKKCQSCYPFLLKNKDIKSINKIFADIKREYGSIDVLINYWQCTQPSLLSETFSFDNTIADLTSSLYIFGRCAAANMMDEGKGLILNIPCLLVHNKTEYDLISSNTVIRGLTQSWGQELAHTKIRVGGVLNLIRHDDQGKLLHNNSVNYDMIDNIVYIIENDSFTCRVIEVS